MNEKDFDKEFELIAISDTLRDMHQWAEDNLKP